MYVLYPKRFLPSGPCVDVTEHPPGETHPWFVLKELTDFPLPMGKRCWQVGSVLSYSYICLQSNL